MGNEIPVFTRVYYGAFAILLASIAILVISIASVTVGVSREVKSIRLILQNDYEYVSETTQQKDGQSLSPKEIKTEASQRTQ
jgi:hypothetical protein